MRKRYGVKNVLSQQVLATRHVFHPVCASGFATLRSTRCRIRLGRPPRSAAWDRCEHIRSRYFQCLETTSSKKERTRCAIRLARTVHRTAHSWSDKFAWHRLDFSTACVDAPRGRADQTPAAQHRLARSRRPLRLVVPDPLHPRNQESPGEDPKRIVSYSLPWEARFPTRGGYRWRMKYWKSACRSACCPQQPTQLVKSQFWL